MLSQSSQSICLADILLELLIAWTFQCWFCCWIEIYSCREIVQENIGMESCWEIFFIKKKVCITWCLKLFEKRKIPIFWLCATPTTGDTWGIISYFSKIYAIFMFLQLGIYVLWLETLPTLHISICNKNANTKNPFVK